MTEEEQKAIEELKSTTNLFNYVTVFEKDYLIESIKIVLNLMQKQQEEIENYKKILTSTHAQYLNERIEKEKQHEEQLEALNEGWKIELEKKNNKILEIQDKL